jgi:hypothetical protein
MKERIENINGTISISSQEGFMIVCVIPNKPYEKIMEEENERCNCR